MEKEIPSLTDPEQHGDSNPGLPPGSLELSPLAQSSSEAPIPALGRQGSLSQHIPGPTRNRQLWLSRRGLGVRICTRFPGISEAPQGLMVSAWYHIADRKQDGTLEPVMFPCLWSHLAFRALQ